MSDEWPPRVPTIGPLVDVRKPPWAPPSGHPLGHAGAAPGSGADQSPGSRRPDAPVWSWVAFGVSLAIGVVLGVMTLLLSVGRGIGCSMEDDCGSGAWLTTLIVIAVLALAVPAGAIVAIRSRARAAAPLLVGVMFVPAVAWIVAFWVIAT